jgi:hypothetical protein
MWVNSRVSVSCLLVCVYVGTFGLLAGVGEMYLCTVALKMHRQAENT